MDLDQLMGGASRQPPLELDLTVDDLMDSADSVVTSLDSSGTSSGLDEWNAFPARTQAAPGLEAAGSPGRRRSPVGWVPATDPAASHASADDPQAAPARAARKPPRWEMPPTGPKARLPASD